MSNLMDSDAGSELFSSYEAELKLVQADLNQKLDQLPELEGEPRKAAISQAERAIDEAKEIVCRYRGTSRGRCRAVAFTRLSKSC